MLSLITGIVMGALLIAGPSYYVRTRWIRQNIKEYKKVIGFLLAFPEHPAHAFMDIEGLRKHLAFERTELRRFRREALEVAFWYVWAPVGFFIVLFTTLGHEIRSKHPHKHLDLGKIREEEGR